MTGFDGCGHLEGNLLQTEVNSGESVKTHAAPAEGNSSQAPIRKVAGAVLWVKDKALIAGTLVCQGVCTLTCDHSGAVHEPQLTKRIFPPLLQKHFASQSK